MYPSFVLAVLLTLTGQEDANALKPGDKVYTHTPERRADAPVAVDAAAYRALLLNIKNEDMSSLGYLIQNGKVYGKRPGGQVEIVRLHDDEDLPLPVPAAVVRMLDGQRKGKVVWIPLQHLRHPSAPPPKGEYRLPLFLRHRLTDYVPERGDTVSLVSDAAGSVYVSADFANLQRYVVATQANDRRLADRMRTLEQVIPVDDRTNAEVLSDSPRAATRSVGAIRVRIIEGPHKGTAVWASLNDVTPTKNGVARFQLTIERPKQARPSRSVGEKADTLLRAARNLEKSKKLPAAVEYYRRVVNEFPSSPEAVEAAERIKALTK